MLGRSLKSGETGYGRILIFVPDKPLVPFPALLVRNAVGKSRFPASSFLPLSATVVIPVGYAVIIFCLFISSGTGTPSRDPLNCPLFDQVNSSLGTRAMPSDFFPKYDRLDSPTSSTRSRNGAGCDGCPSCDTGQLIQETTAGPYNQQIRTFCDIPHKLTSNTVYPSLVTQFAFLLASVTYGLLLPQSPAAFDSTSTTAGLRYAVGNEAGLMQIAKEDSSKTIPAADPDGELICKIASSMADFDSAFQLVYQKYLSRGLIEPNPFARRVVPYHLKSTTTTFIAYRGGTAVCTTTLIGDSEDGLPLEALYPAEIERKRMAGLRLAEVSCLAGCGSGSDRNFHRLFMKLMRILGQHAERFGIDQLVVAVHPRHARYYERTMGFQQFGSEVRYESLQDAPAVGIALDFGHGKKNRPPAYDMIFGSKLPLQEIMPRPMPEDFVEYFEPMIDLTDVCVPLLF